jgi:hypothetical protein
MDFDGQYRADLLTYTYEPLAPALIQVIGVFGGGVTTVAVEHHMPAFNVDLHAVDTNTIVASKDGIDYAFHRDLENVLLQNTFWADVGGGTKALLTNVGMQYRTDGYEWSLVLAQADGQYERFHLKDMPETVPTAFLAG